MTDSTVELQVGDLRFSAAGPCDWTEARFGQFLSWLPDGLVKATALAAAESRASEAVSAGATRANGSLPKAEPPPLAKFLASAGAVDGTQERVFLATAAWLMLRGNGRFTAADVTKALKTAAQKPLSNANRNLTQNVSKGLCVKDGNSCYVTVHGWQALGMEPPE